MNIKKSQLKEMIKAVAREAINERKEKWIQKAVNPKHKGYCTPMTKKTCTPRRKALAKRFKKGIDEGENPFKDKGEDTEKKENPFKKKDEEPEEPETPETDTAEEPETPETDTVEEPTGTAEPPAGDESGEEHEYDEKEEILLIKVVEKAVQKLLDMHQGMEGSEEDPTVAIGVDEPPEGDIPVEEPPVDGAPKGEEVPVEEPPVDGAPEEEEPTDENSVPKDYAGENERMRQLQQEKAPPGFGPDKAHADIYNKVKAQYGADSPKAYATMWSIYNKMDEAARSALEECGMEEAGLTSEMGPEHKMTPLDDIVRLVKNKGLEDPKKEEYLVSKLFKHQVGKDVDPDALKQALERGGTSEMHEGDDKWIQKAVNPAHKGYCTPMTKKTCTPRRKALAMRFKKGDIHKDNVEADESGTDRGEREVDENTVDMKMGPSYKIEQPHMYQTAEMDWARTNEYDPEITELFAAGENNTCPQCQTALKESDEGKLRCDNPMCECSKKLYEFTRRNFKEPKISENHKVQARSYWTSNDGAQDPNNVRDPEVPGP
jgi:hypothetical protein